MNRRVSSGHGRKATCSECKPERVVLRPVAADSARSWHAATLSISLNPWFTGVLKSNLTWRKENNIKNFNNSQGLPKIHLSRDPTMADR